MIALAARAARMVLMACRRVAEGRTRDHRRMRLSLIVTLAGLAAWFVLRITS